MNTIEIERSKKTYVVRIRPNRRELPDPCYCRRLYHHVTLEFDKLNCRRLTLAFSLMPGTLLLFQGHNSRFPLSSHFLLTYHPAKAANVTVVKFHQSATTSFMYPLVFISMTIHSNIRSHHQKRDAHSPLQRISAEQELSCDKLTNGRRTSWRKAQYHEANQILVPWMESNMYRHRARYAWHKHLLSSPVSVCLAPLSHLQALCQSVEEAQIHLAFHE